MTAILELLNEVIYEVEGPKGFQYKSKLETEPIRCCTQYMLIGHSTGQVLLVSTLE